jgi:phage pi2 protein 07
MRLNDLKNKIKKGIREPELREYMEANNFGFCYYCSEVFDKKDLKQGRIKNFIVSACPIHFKRKHLQEIPSGISDTSSDQTCSQTSETLLRS